MKVDFYIVDSNRPDVVSRSMQPDGFSQYRQKRILAQKKDAARRLSTAAGIAVEEGLRKAGIAEKEVVYSISKRGKPYIGDHPEIAFSVSHSGNFAVAAFAIEPDRKYSLFAGVDIEQVSRMNDRIRSVMAGDTGFKDEADPEEMCRRWTAREAFVKCIGTGLGAIRDNFFFEKTDTGEIVLHQTKYGGEFYIFEPQAPDGYHITCIIRRVIKGGIL